MIELISAYEFAKRKNVAPKSVYMRMKTEKRPNGDITTVKAGKQHFINWDENKHITFKTK